MLRTIGSKNVNANQFGYRINSISYSNYLFGSGIAGVEKSDICLLVGANPRQVTPVLNAGIGKMVRNGHTHVARIVIETVKLTHIEELGEDLSSLESILGGKGDFAKKLQDASKSMIIVGDSILTHLDSRSILSLLCMI